MGYWMDFLRMGLPPKWMVDDGSWWFMIKGVHSHGGTPIAGWFTRENPTKMDENWGCPYFGKPTSRVWERKKTQLLGGFHWWNWSQQNMLGKSLELSELKWPKHGGHFFLDLVHEHGFLQHSPGKKWARGEECSWQLCRSESLPPLCSTSLVRRQPILDFWWICVGAGSMFHTCRLQTLESARVWCVRDTKDPRQLQILQASRW